MPAATASIQYTRNIRAWLGEPVETTGEPLSVELAPGLISSIFDEYSGR